MYSSRLTLQTTYLLNKDLEPSLVGQRFTTKITRKFVLVVLLLVLMYAALEVWRDTVTHDPEQVGLEQLEIAKVCDLMCILPLLMKLAHLQRMNATHFGQLVSHFQNYHGSDLLILNVITLMFLR